jgi:crossover junction endodeoxyribonuclease RuvC
MANVKTMGLDLSLTSTGICVSGITSTQNVKSKGPQRLFEISEAILELTRIHKVDVAIIEGYSFASRNSQAHSIGELGGVVRLRLWENKIPFIEIPPTSRAKFATGRGNAAKTEVMSSVSARTGIVWSGKGADDKCDAWILEQMGLSYLGISEITWPASHLEALKKVDWSPLQQLQRKVVS